MPEASSRSPVTPRATWLEGVVAGPHSPVVDMPLRSLVEYLDAWCHAEVELDEARFAVLIERRADSKAQPDRDWQDGLLAALQKIADCVDVPLESTLRATEVHARQTTETAFATAGRQLRAVRRTRPTTAADLRHAIAPPHAPSARPRRLWITVLTALAALLLAWEVGLVDRALAPPADQLALEHPGLEGVLSVAVERSWGSYRVTLARGPDFPQRPTDRDRLLAASRTLTERAVRRAVCDGGRLFVRLHRRSGDVLLAVPVELGALLAAPDARCTVVIPGRRDAARLSIALGAD